MQLYKQVEPPIKPTAVKFSFMLFVALLSVGCNHKLPSSPPTELNLAPQSRPLKELLVTYGRYDKPYGTLGPIDYTLKSTSTSDDQIELWDRAIDFLKLAALSKYGDKVDAIVDVELAESEEESNGKLLNIIHVQGVAITFNGGIKPINKNKVKYKARYKAKPRHKLPKPISSKTKSAKKIPDKAKEEEIEISPSELLK